ncbi:MAG: tetraacyldisaccharide 4'-kinase [Pseudomonadota bacterium]
MRAPAFWYRRDSLASRMLAPLGGIYAGVTARRLARARGVRPEVPVICVGNLTVGGAGKTPTVMALLGVLQDRGLKPAVLSRGYGGSLGGPVLVDPERHNADDVGDEPLLLSAFAPVWVSRDRGAGALEAAKGADVIVMDDGFQNPSVLKDLSVLVVDAQRNFGNRRVLPAGPLREPVAAGLKRANLISVVGAPDYRGAFIADWHDQFGDLPVLEAALEPLATGMAWAGMRAYAFAGIANPDRFFRTLRALGADLCGAQSLDDHQPLTSRLLARLTAEAQRMNAQLVTTEKDAVRLPTHLRRQILTLPVRLNWADQGPLDAALDRLFA